MELKSAACPRTDLAVARRDERLSPPARRCFVLHHLLEIPSNDYINCYGASQGKCYVLDSLRNRHRRLAAPYHDYPVASWSACTRCRRPDYWLLSIRAILAFIYYRVSISHGSLQAGHPCSIQPEVASFVRWCSSRCVFYSAAATKHQDGLAMFRVH